MTAFVVLAAGRGSRLGRLGDELPKCLLPLNGQAVLSHQFALAPVDARLIVVTGYRADQVEEYVRLAHPERDVTLVREVEWGRGPGASLLEAKEIIGDDDLVFVACDTLWERYEDLWDEGNSWLAVAPVPAGTPNARWCRVQTDVSGEFVQEIFDKVPDVVSAHCWTALGKINADDLPTFWRGLLDGNQHAGELQLSSGIKAVVAHGDPVTVQHVNWLDVGDEQAYRAAIATVGGYDPLKPDQITYVNPSGRVVKWHVNRDKIRWRIERAKRIGDAVPRVYETFNGTMTGYDFQGGVSSYAVVERNTTHVDALLDWWEHRFWNTRTLFEDVPVRDVYDASIRFYRDKTMDRVEALEPTLRAIALDAVTRVDWDALLEHVVPGTFHGDLTFANVITWDDDWNTRFIGIDWREDYAGVTEWGDLRYDLGKLLCATRFHWERAAYGDFRRWSLGPNVERRIENVIVDRFRVNIDDVRRVAALCLINSAPLHAAPMDEILVARGTRWLESLT